MGIKSRIELARGLRELADAIDAAESGSRIYAAPTVQLFTTNAEDMAAVRRDFGGGRWEKDALPTGSMFYLRREFAGGVRLELLASRENVCEAVQVGTRVVRVPDPEKAALVPTIPKEEAIIEWRCHPILADFDSTAAEQAGDLEGTADEVFGELPA